MRRQLRRRRSTPGHARDKLGGRERPQCGAVVIEPESSRELRDSWDGGVGLLGGMSPPPSSGTFHPPDLDRAYLPSLRASSLRCGSRT
jgi:hypothetical protein